MATLKERKLPLAGLYCPPSLLFSLNSTACGNIVAATISERRSWLRQTLQALYGRCAHSVSPFRGWGGEKEKSKRRPGYGKPSVPSTSTHCLPTLSWLPLALLIGCTAAPYGWCWTWCGGGVYGDSRTFTRNCLYPTSVLLCTRSLSSLRLHCTLIVRCRNRTVRSNFE